MFDPSIEPAGTVPVRSSVDVDPSDHVGWLSVSPVNAKKATMSMLAIETYTWKVRMSRPVRPRRGPRRRSTSIVAGAGIAAGGPAGGGERSSGNAHHDLGQLAVTDDGRRAAD